MMLPGVRFSVPVLRLGMSILAMIAIPLEAYGEAKTALRWKFQKGEHLHLAVEADSTDNMNLSALDPGAVDSKSTVSRTVEYAWSVKDVADDGTAQISLTLERLRIKVRAPGGELSEDTKAGPQKGSETSIALQGVIGGTLTFRMTSQGEVKDFKLSDGLTKSMAGAAACGLTEDSLKQDIQWTVLTLPREPVEAGAQWSRRFDKPAPGISNETQEFVYAYRGPSDGPNRGSQTIGVTSKLDIKADPQGVYRMEMRYKSQDGRGTIYFDNTVGRLLSVDFTQKFELGLTMLGKETVNSHEEHLKVTLRRETKPRSQK